ncbi:MAG: thymidine phosphorylase [Clostridia bacterium]
MDIEKIVEKKLENKSLSFEEIEFVITAYCNNEIGDREMTPFLKAIFEKGMTEDEVFDLTIIMQNSGEVVDFGENRHLFVDKHSSGGVSDSTTLALVPLVSIMGMKILKMSGRSLRHTGGTINKLEVFKNFKTELPLQEALKIADKIGGAMISQSDSLVPADKKIYALRDRTGYVESLPLIASSIMSKKLASGAGTILLDVKVGDGALMKTNRKAIALAKCMVKIGKKSGRKVVAIISDMSEPLGNSIGDTLEVCEAIETFKNWKSNLGKLVVEMAGILYAQTFHKSVREGKKLAIKLIENGSALAQLKKIVKAQGGEFFDSEKKLKSMPYREILAIKSGFVTKIFAENLGRLIHENRFLKGQDAGVVLKKKVGDKVSVGDVILLMYDISNELDVQFENCVKIGKIKKIRKPIIKKIINK